MLCGASVALAATAGCLQQIRNLAGRERSSPLSLSIKTLPTDADPYAIRIARTLADALETVGVETQLHPMAREELYRQLLVTHDFDLYVAPLLGQTDPDFLRPLLHSRFVGERGNQNPFGYVDLATDDLLDAQRRAGRRDRQPPVVDLQAAVAQAQPFTVLAYPDDVLAGRTDRFSGWSEHPPTTAIAYLAATRERPDADVLTAALRDPRPTRNLNPIAAEYRDRGTVTDLLYDSLAREHGEAVSPWLATRWEWVDGTDGGLRATVHLREATWHDGRALTAADVAFTYRFLRDTSLGEADAPVPAERFRGRGSLVTDASVVDDRTVELAFGDTARGVARRALTVPILPRHVWRSRTEAATVAGVSVSEETTRALVWSNTNPIGSGPLRLRALEEDRRVVLTPVRDHFSGSLDGELGEVVGDGPAFDRLVFEVVPSDAVAVQTVREGQVDVTATPLGAPVVSELEAAVADDPIEMVVDPSPVFYHVGYNVRRAPLSNPRFRRAVARLLDKRHVVESVFEGYAMPATSPLATTDWLSSALAWDGTDPVLPYFGSDGELDVERARAAFVEAGYRFRDGALHQR